MPDQPIEFVEIEAIYTKKTRQIAWRELADRDMWIQGWK